MGTLTPEMPARLAESAFRLFSRDGFKKIKLDQIAADAGVTKGSLYWHYKSKDELVKAACAHYYRAYHRRINSELSHITDPVDRLERTLQLAVQICLLDEENRVFTTEVFTLALHDVDVRRSWQQFYDSVREFYVGLVKAAQSVGGLETDDAEHAVDFMLATMEGIKLQAMYDPKICGKPAEKAIVQSLKRTLGFPGTKS
jgi:AcrR family transcriptional regulator